MAKSVKAVSNDRQARTRPGVAVRLDNARRGSGCTDVPSISFE